MKFQRNVILQLAFVVPSAVVALAPLQSPVLKTTNAVGSSRTALNVVSIPIPSDQSDVASSTEETPLNIDLSNNGKLQKDENNEEGTLLTYDSDGIPRLGSLMKILPKETFQVDTKTSLFYFAIDTVACVASLGFLYAVVTSAFYGNLALWQQALTVAPLQILAGFAMWCQWCIGHDAGHSVVSKTKPWINDVVGEIAHSMFCLTPFVPWQLSHRMHHKNHNHLTKDYSHQWFIKEERDELVWWIKASHATRNLQLPFLYLIYLLVGVPDGGHVFFYGRLWDEYSPETKVRAALSSGISLVTACGLWAAMGTANFAVCIFAPWLVMSFWLFMVTYLQHHSDDGKLYTDDTFTFTKGAFETVDRSYGKWINRMSHHMMDGHVMHHLFFEKVPHYRLEKATKALVEGLEKDGKGHLYKQIETEDFTQEIIRQFDANWFFVNEKQIVRK